mgnify:CR=1 FL=1
MKTYDVVLVKSYIVKIKARNEERAKRLSEFFTGDIQSVIILAICPAFPQFGPDFTVTI